jgi:hypothetical protein
VHAAGTGRPIGRRWALLLAPLLMAAAPDTTPPELHITLDDIPQGESRLLVVPPDRFRIVLGWSDAGSEVDTASLHVVSSEAIGRIPAGAELAPYFEVTPWGAVWEVPAGSDLARTSHWLHASIRDRAGNTAEQSYGFAVREFEDGAPLDPLQVVYLNFDRHDDGQQAFKASLRELGLSSAAAPRLEQEIVDRLRVEIVRRVHAMYGRNPDGTPGPDPANILFTWFDPQTPHTSLCIGGTHPSNPIALGAAPLDYDNFDQEQDECAVEDHGVFPSAIGALWGEDPLFQQVFSPLLPARGGTPIGESDADARLLAPDFDAGRATPAERARLAQIEDALDAFAQVVAVAAAHEVGHTLGLAAPGPAPAGLYGGSAGDAFEHNVTPQGNYPGQNFIMNFGGTFSFAEITGRQGHPKPFFRAIAWAYLTHRLVRNEFVTELLPAPRILSVTPNPARFESAYSVDIEIHGEHLGDVENVELVANSQSPVPVLDLRLVDDRTLAGRLYVLFSPPGRYGVRVANRDQQTAQLADAVEVLPWVRPAHPGRIRGRRP